MAHIQLNANSFSAQRNWFGWGALAMMFGLIIPATIVASFKGTDAKSTDPAVQANNLEAIVSEESPKDAKTTDLQGVVRAMAPKHAADEDAAAVYAAAMVELHKPLTAADLALLAKSKTTARQTVAELYANPPLPPDRVRTLVPTLPKDRYLYRLAKAQSLQQVGDWSARRALSPGFNEAAMRPKLAILTVLYSTALFLGCLAIVGYLSALRTRALKWRGHPLEPVNLVEADRLAVRAAQFFGIFLFVELGVAVVAGGFPGSKTAAGAMVAEILASSAVILATVLVTRWPIGGRSLRLADYGLTRDAIMPSLLWGVGGLLAVVPLATVGALIGLLIEHIAPRPDHPLLHMLEDSHNLLFVGGAFFLASIQAPFTEELLFRGTLTPALSGLFRNRSYAAPLAIGVSSLVFASIHPQGFTLWLPLASVGVVNGVLCYQTRSVLPGMVMHALFNAVALISTLFIR